MLDVAGIVVGIWRANTHGLDFVDTSHLVDDNLQGFNGSVDVCLTCFITLGFDGGCSLDVATAVNDAENGVCSS